MCTVSYIPLAGDDFILTSNRDETPLRKTIPPETYTENGLQITYPKDKLAGGTWVGVSSYQRVICLLNGAFEKHKREKSYRLSRGVVVKNLLTCDDVMKEIESFDYSGIEPFTLISIDWKKDRIAHEFIWDGKTKHVRELDTEPQIWSSSPLYDADMKKERHSWFEEFTETNQPLSQESLLKFHQSERQEDRKNSIRMKRLFVETVSTTSISKKGKEIDLRYFDYLNEANTKQMKLEILQ